MLRDIDVRIPAGEFVAIVGRVNTVIRTGGEGVVPAEVEAACIDLKGRARKPPPGMAEALAPLFAPPP